MTNFAKVFIATAQAQETQQQTGTQTATSSDAPQKTPGGTLGMFLPMIFVFVIFYFLMIRPQSKQRKQHQQLIQNLKKGDEIVSTAGIHGRISGIADSVVTLEIADNIRIKLDRAQIATVKQAQAS